MASMASINVRFVDTFSDQTVNHARILGRRKCFQISPPTRTLQTSANRPVRFLKFVVVLLSAGIVQGFNVPFLNSVRPRPSRRISMTNSDEVESEENPFFEDEDKEEFEVSSGFDDNTGVVLDDLHWRVAKLKLEEANTRRFLRAKPRYLPYDECRKWVIAWSRWKSEKEWKEWIDMGEKRNSYIPARPDEYYGALGQWRNWDHFLGFADDDESNEVLVGEFE